MLKQNMYPPNPSTANTRNDSNFLDRQPQFFIIGVQRSGTTVLRLILNNHSAISIPEEASFLKPLLTKKNLMNPLPLSRKRKRIILRYLLDDYQFKKWRMEEELLSPLMEKQLTMRQLIGFLYVTFGQKHGKHMCGEKNPTFIRKLKLLRDVYPNAKFIHIVRDGRDVYLSFKSRSHYSAASLALSSFEWSIKLSIIHRALKKAGSRVFELRYEDLIRDPVSQIKRVCSFLDVSFEEHMLDFWMHSSDFIDKEHSELIFRPIESANAFKWKNKLRSNELNKYDFFSHRNLRRYGYEVSGKPPKPRDKLLYLFELMVHIPKRLLRIINIITYMRLASAFGLTLSRKYYE